MAAIKNNLDVGDIVELVEDCSNMQYRFTKGHIMRIVSSGMRGFDMEDADGKCIGEVSPSKVKLAERAAINSSIRAYLRGLVGKSVQFHDEKKTEYLESYPEAGMRAKIITIVKTDSEDTDDEFYVITVDYSDFDEHNKALETSNYYDKHGNAVLTARQANQYEPQENLYISARDLRDILKPIDDRVMALVEQFEKSGKSNYTEWLEEQVLSTMK